MAQHTGSKKILVIDDQPDIRLMCRVNLALEGYDVIEANEGMTGLEMMQSETPDLVLLDVMMPVLDGWSVLEAAKADPQLAGIPVVLLTARVQREDEIKGWQLGASDYLAKPFNPSTLSEVVRNALADADGSERRKRALRKLTLL